MNEISVFIERTVSGSFLFTVLSMLLFVELLIPTNVAADNVMKDKEWQLFRFDNGFNLLVKEDHSNPMAASIITVKAGAVYEDSTTLGMTHFLEHLLFDGTAERSREEIWKGIKRKGGYINAFTRKTATVFMMLIPSDDFDFGLDIQADMLLNSIIPESELDKERKVVIEEILQSMDSPGTNEDNICAQYFLGGTSYTEPVLGYKELIERVPRDVILNYYKKMYTPANMIGVCMGDINGDDVRKLYESYFGGEAEKGLPSPPEPMKEYSPGGSYKRVTGNFTSRKLEVAWVIPGIDSPDYQEYLVSSKILETTIKKSDFEKKGNLNVSSWIEPYYGFSLMRVSVNLSEGMKPEGVLEGVLEDITTLSQNGPNPDDVKMTTVTLEAQKFRYEEKYHHFAMYKGVDIALGGVEIVLKHEDLNKIQTTDVKACFQELASGNRYRAIYLEPDSQQLKKTKSMGMMGM